MTDIQISMNVTLGALAARARRSIKRQTYALKKHLQKIAKQSKFQPGAHTSDDWIRPGNRRAGPKEAHGTKQPQAYENKEAHYTSPKLGKRNAIQSFGAPSRLVHKAARVADNDTDVEQPGCSILDTSTAKECDMHQAAEPAFILSQQPHCTTKRAAKRQRAGKGKKAISSAKKPNKFCKGSHNQAPPGNTTTKSTATKTQLVDTAKQRTNNMSKRCQLQQPTPGASTEHRPSKRVRVTQAAAALPCDIYEVIARLLEGQDLVSFMAVSKPVATMVLSSRRTSGKPSVTVSIDRNTNWLPLHQIINIGTSIRLMITEACEAAVEASLSGEDSIPGVSEVVMKKDGMLPELPYLAKACCNAHAYDLQFRIADIHMEDLVRTPNITHLTVAGIQYLFNDWRKYACGWRSLRIHGEHVEYSSMAFLPLQSLSQEVEWTSPTGLMCLVMPDSKDPTGLEQVMQAHANMHYAFFQLFPEEVLHYLVPRAMYHAYPEGADVEQAQDEYHALAVAPHWPVIDAKILSSNRSTYVTIVTTQNGVPATGPQGEDRAVDCLRYCDQNVDYDWQCRHFNAATSIAKLLEY